VETRVFTVRGIVPLLDKFSEYSGDEGIIANFIVEEKFNV